MRLLVTLELHVLNNDNHFHHNQSGPRQVSDRLRSAYWLTCRMKLGANISPREEAGSTLGVEWDDLAHCQNLARSLHVCKNRRMAWLYGPVRARAPGCHRTLPKPGFNWLETCGTCICSISQCESASDTCTKSGTKGDKYEALRKPGAVVYPNTLVVDTGAQIRDRHKQLGIHRHPRSGVCQKADAEDTCVMLTWRQKPLLSLAAIDAMPRWCSTNRIESPKKTRTARKGPEASLKRSVGQNLTAALELLGHMCIASVTPSSVTAKRGNMVRLLLLGGFLDTLVWYLSTCTCVLSQVTFEVPGGV